MNQDHLLSNEEKRAKLKEEYKKEFLAKKQFLEKVESQRHLHNINAALKKLLQITGDKENEVEPLSQISSPQEKLLIDIDLDLAKAPKEIEQKQDPLSSNDIKTLGDMINLIHEEPTRIKKTLGDWEK
ncbi:MAG: hypothetical protein RML72_03935 [Bacteroidia bacterium]|nr:hypothetical protein [Bacteroidia bacterium]MDW8158013.1 hypothetical protein [Bacteroidia bacterium]